jgi:hypothetical protein
MGVTVTWDDNTYTILRYDLTGLWTWDDYCLAVDKGAAMLEMIQHPVAVIANFRADTMVPRSITTPETKSAPVKRQNVLPENIGLIVVTGGAAFVEVMVSGFCRAYQRFERNLLVASSLDEARKLIVDHLPGTAAQA